MSARLDGAARPDGRSGIDAALVRRLVATQFPQWLPILAPQLPLEIPLPLAQGRPALGYPHPWSVYRWIAGDTARPDRIDDLRRFARTLGEFLLALQRVDATDGPMPGAHNFYRGGPLTTYDAETRQAVATLGARVDGRAALAVWEAGLAATWHGSSVWLHGDIACGNLLVRAGRLCAVIDFGTSGVGDPSCDLVIAWTSLVGPSREAFVATVRAGAAMWARARGWALWKALIMLAAADDGSEVAAINRRVIGEVLADHERSG